MAREVTDLRRALQTRPTIDQAKGIIMADRRCTPEEAFELLKKLSMESNVRLADVAAAIVYQAQHGGEPGREERS
jgi:response regulator NasT